jgi:hypothetical protein
MEKQNSYRMLQPRAVFENSEVGEPVDFQKIQKNQ